MGWASKRTRKPEPPVQKVAKPPKRRQQTVARALNHSAPREECKGCQRLAPMIGSPEMPGAAAANAGGQGDGKGVNRAAPPIMGFLGRNLQQIIERGVEGQERQARLVADREAEADEEFAAVADRYRETPYLAQLAATHRARARNAIRWRPRYLAAYAISGNHTWASDAAGVNRKTVELHAKNDAIFQEQCLDAEARASDLLFGACFKSAIEGDCRPVYQQGMCVGYVREYDSRMRVEMLRALRPHQFKTPGAGNVTRTDSRSISTRRWSCSALMMGTTATRATRVGRAERPGSMRPASTATTSRCCRARTSRLSPAPSGRRFR